MADRAINTLTPVEHIGMQDNFVVEQNNSAMRVTGQVFVTDLASLLDGHGGINSITGPVTSVLNDTYTIHYADATTSQFTVKNGRGITSITGPVNSGTAGNGQTHTYTINYNDGSTPTTIVVKDGVKGNTGDTGPANTATGTTTKYGQSASNNTVPTTWYNTIGEVPMQAGLFLWTKLVINFNSGNSGEIYNVTKWGVDGSGAVDSVNGRGGNVFLYGYGICEH